MKNDNVLFSVIIKIKKDSIRIINNLFDYKVKIIKQDKNYYYLKFLEKDLFKLDNNNIEYTIISYRGIKHLYRVILTNFSVFLGIVIFLSILYINTLSIREISFSTYTKDNNKIKAILEDNITSYNSIKFLNNDINDINLILRKEFNDFEWISVKKEGCVLYVTILEPSIINKQVKHIEGYGDLVAKSDGVIKFFQVSHGIPLVETNQFVKKGQILVSGNLRINNQDESEFYIPSEGKVYAEVWYTKTVEVNKKDMKTEYTGKISTEKKLSIFNFDIKYKSINKKYDKYDTEVVTDKLKIFNFELPIGIKKIHYLEKNDIINIYDKNTSYDCAYSSVKYDIYRTFLKDDKILSIDMLTQSEDEEKFTYVFLVRTYENIAIFQRRNIDE